MPALWAILAQCPCRLAKCIIDPRANSQTKFKGKTIMDSANDRKAHEKTYGSFIAMLKWVIPLLAVITAVVVVLISS